jgi:hypothetical protein
MCAHNHSKGDAADPVDDHVTATILWRTAAALLDVPVAMQPGAAPEIRTSEMVKIWRKPVPDLLRHGGSLYPADLRARLHLVGLVASLHSLPKDRWK